MIRIESLHFHYPGTDFQLAIPRLDVAAGEKVAVVGPSRSGKTTLLNLIGGILTTGDGEVQVGEVRLNDLPPSDRSEVC